MLFYRIYLLTLPAVVVLIHILSKNIIFWGVFNIFLIYKSVYFHVDCNILIVHCLF